MKELLGLLVCMLLIVIALSVTGDEDATKAVKRFWNGTLTVISEIGEAWRGESTPGSE